MKPNKTPQTTNRLLDMITIGTAIFSLTSLMLAPMAKSAEDGGFSKEAAIDASRKLHVAAAGAKIDKALDDSFGSGVEAEKKRQKFQSDIAARKTAYDAAMKTAATGKLDPDIEAILVIMAPGAEQRYLGHRRLVGQQMRYFEDGLKWMQDFEEALGPDGLAPLVAANPELSAKVAVMLQKVKDQRMGTPDFPTGAQIPANVAEPQKWYAAKNILAGSRPTGYTLDDSQEERGMWSKYQTWIDYYKRDFSRAAINARKVLAECYTMLRAEETQKIIVDAVQANPALRTQTDKFKDFAAKPQPFEDMVPMKLGMLLQPSSPVVSPEKVNQNPIPNDGVNREWEILCDYFDSSRSYGATAFSWQIFPSGNTYAKKYGRDIGVTPATTAKDAKVQGEKCLTAIKVALKSMLPAKKAMANLAVGRMSEADARQALETCKKAVYPQFTTIVVEGGLVEEMHDQINAGLKRLATKRELDGLSRNNWYSMPYRFIMPLVVQQRLLNSVRSPLMSMKMDKSLIGPRIQGAYNDTDPIPLSTLPRTVAGLTKGKTSIQAVEPAGDQDFGEE